MGGKMTGRSATPADVAKYVDAVPEVYRENFDVLRALIRRVIPRAAESMKWGTIHYDLPGNLFALSVSKKHINFYILERGVIEEHKRELAGIPWTNCCLRFPPGAAVPKATLEKVMRVALSRQS